MCGGFFELFLAKDFGASCAEVKIAVCQEATQSTGTDGKGEYESLSKGGDGLKTNVSDNRQGRKGGDQGNDGCRKSRLCHYQGNRCNHYRRRLGCGLDYYSCLLDTVFDRIYGGVAF